MVVGENSEIGGRPRPKADQLDEGNHVRSDPAARRALDQLRRSTTSPTFSVGLSRDHLTRIWVPIRSVLSDRSLAKVVAVSTAVLLAALIVAAIFVRGSIEPDQPPVLSEPAATMASTTSSSLPTVVIAVGGAVRAPGVYRLPVGSRVVDALEAAGGPAADIDLDRINLAALVVDSEHVWLTRMGEATSGGVAGGSSSAPSGTKGGPVDLNSATIDQLDDLPGIGPTTAEAIIDRRREVGRFRSVDDLLSVRGIGAAKLDALRSSVVVR